LVAFILITFAGFATAKSFDDVPKTHWAYDAVEYLASKGLVEGFPDGTYQGNKTMTRYELAMLVARAYAKMEEMIAAGGKSTVDVEAIMNDLMEEFNPEIDELRTMVDANGAKIVDLEKKLQENSVKDADLAAKLDKLGSKFKFNGTMKLRWDGKYYNPGDKRIQRPRMSFRFDMKAPVNEEITFGGRLATGGEGANIATETTLTDEFGLKAFDLERAYLEWKPAAWPHWTFTGGKFMPNWKTPANFVDADVNVEGLAQTYSDGQWVLNLAETTPADKGGYVVAQVGAEDLFWNNFYAYLTYHYMSSGAFETMGAGFPWWTQLDADNYAAVEGYAKYNFTWYDYPIFVETAYRQNLADARAGLPVRADSPLNQAAMAQLRIGDIKEVNDYDIWFNYGRVQPNALIPQFANSTWGVDHDTYTVGIDYLLMEHTLFKFMFTRANNINTDPDGSFDYICADIVCDF